MEMEMQLVSTLASSKSFFDTNSYTRPKTARHNCKIALVTEFTGFVVALVSQGFYRCNQMAQNMQLLLLEFAHYD